MTEFHKVPTTYTYFGNGKSVLDYALENGDALSGIKNFKVLEEIGSDHLPIRIEWIGEREKKKKKYEFKVVYDWSEWGIQEYREKLRMESMNQGGWSELKEKIQRAMVRKEIKIRVGGRSEKWWDEGCFLKKQKYKEALHEWRNTENKEVEKIFRLRRWEYKIQIEKSKKEFSDKMIKELGRINGLSGYWDVINRMRGKKKKK